jgi:hypothetical protein
MQLLQGAALGMEDRIRDAIFAQFAEKSGRNSPAVVAEKPLPDVKTVWLRAVEALPAPAKAPDDSPDSLFATLADRQELLNLFRW